MNFGEAMREGEEAPSPSTSERESERAEGPAPACSIQRAYESGTLPCVTHLEKNGLERVSLLTVTAGREKRKEMRGTLVGVPRVRYRAKFRRPRVNGEAGQRKYRYRVTALEITLDQF